MTGSTADENQHSSEHGPPVEGQRQAAPELPGLSMPAWKSTIAPLLEQQHQPKFRLQQIRAWVFKKEAVDFSGMTDLPEALRQILADLLVLHPLELELERQSTDGTRKFLWKRARGEPIESVLIPDNDRTTYCISSQAGCPVACTFCATGFGGFSGQLSSGEIVDQVLRMRQRTGMPPTNIVFMGMGEPLLNFNNLRQAIDILCHPDQLGMGARRLTVSTVGIPKHIVELGRKHPQVKLAISLHAARNQLRDTIIPLNRQYPLEMLLKAIRQHHSLTGKMVTFEYILLAGVNNAPRDINDLVRLLEGIPSRINLIGFNPFPGSAYRKPTVAQLTGFRAALEKRFEGPVTIRRSRGEDIQGACGQLSLARKKAER